MLIKLNGMNLRAYYDDDDWDTPAVSHCHGPSTDDSQYVFQLHSIVNHLFGCSKLVNNDDMPRTILERTKITITSSQRK